MAFALAGLRLDRAAEHASGDGIGNCFESGHLHPRVRTLGEPFSAC
jgi:hypothetical protein